jgi:hypothetical protein
MKKARHSDYFTKYDDAIFAQAVITFHDSKIFDDPIDEAVLRKAIDRWEQNL